MNPLNPVFQFLNGKSFKHNGIGGKFEFRTYTDRHGLLVQRLSHNPSRAGQATEAYQKTKRELGDDWNSDLTDSIEAYCEAAHKLGYAG